MIIDTLQILLMLIGATLLAWLYYRMRLLRTAREKEEYQQSYSDIKLRYSAYFTQIEKVENDLREANAQLHEQMEANRKLEYQCEHTQSLQEIQSDKIQTLEGYKKKYDDTVSELRNIQNELDTAKRAISRFERESNERNNEITNLRKQVEEKHALLAQLATLRTKLAPLEVENEIHKNKIEALSTELNKTTEEKADLLDKQRKDKIEITALSSSLTSLRMTQEKYNATLQEIDRYRSIANNLNDELKKAQDTISKLQSEMAQMGQRDNIYNVTNNILTEVRQKYDSLLPQYEKLEQELHNLQQTLANVLNYSNS